MASVLRGTAARPPPLGRCLPGMHRLPPPQPLRPPPPQQPFSTSAPASMGPESPAYVDIPQTLQPDLPRKRAVKGVLPVPRELFPPRRPDKPGAAYLDAATRAPAPANARVPLAPHHRDYPLLAWKRKMAELRRANLREGLVELYARKKQAARRIGAESERKQREREAILAQPERDDERLTRPTTVAAMAQPAAMVQEDGDGADASTAAAAARRLEARRRRYHQLQQARARERQDLLHTLYMNARHFITNEAQLDAHLNRVFQADAQFTSDANNGYSVWVMNAPTSIKDMMGRGERLPEQLYQKQEERLKRLAESLTGGTI
ncbi:hypothetical protein KEM52_006311 [Ascosphaera acerosa]|nr:hypothetical protein KEM52_006311 [Ascosphaera acerosa]